MDAVQGTAVDEKRGTAVIPLTVDIRAHLCQGLHDPFHGAGADGIVPVQHRREELSGQNTGDQPGGRSAVAHIQCQGRGGQAVKAFAFHEHPVSLIADGDAHPAEALDGRQAVGTLEKMGDFGQSISQGAEHHCPVGDGFVSRDHYFSGKSGCFCNLHIAILLCLDVWRHREAVRPRTRCSGIFSAEARHCRRLPARRIQCAARPPRKSGCG